MTTREIPRDEWTAFLDKFSRVHRGQPAHVHAGGDRLDETNLPLLGVDAEGRAGDEGIRITLGTPPHPLVTHAVPQPTHVRAAEWNDGYSAELKIESESGDSTVVHVGPREQLLPPGVITDGIVM